MLNNDDRRAIEGLFERLRDTERNAAPRDAEAEALIRDRIARQPAAPYYMAQTIVVQGQALEMAERRIAELETEAERGSRGGLFGNAGSRRQRERYADERSYERGPWDRGGYGGGGFLAGAAQTAMGVAGGVLLGNAIASMFGAGSAHAAEAPQQDSGSDPGNDGDQDAGSDGGDAGGLDGGGFGDDGGGFDFGGDF